MYKLWRVFLERSLLLRKPVPRPVHVSVITSVRGGDGNESKVDVHGNFPCGELCVAFIVEK